MRISDWSSDVCSSDLFSVEPTEGRFGVLYRSTNMMVNLFPVAEEPRDPNKMSPHHHDDFEQCSLTLQGDFMHYIRWPWTVNKAIWRDDAKIRRSEEHTSELQSLMRISYAVFCLKKKTKNTPES